MKIEEVVRLPDPRSAVKLTAREVVRDTDDRPQVFVRLRLSGWHFPQRAPEPFMVVGKEVSNFVLIGPDGLSADGYFDVMPPPARLVSFGYGKIVSWDFRLAFDPRRVGRLARTRLPSGFIDLRR